MGMVKDSNDVHIFRFYLDGVLLTETPIEMCNNGLAPTEIKTLLHQGVDGSSQGDGVRIKNWRYHAEGITSTYGQMPANANYVDINEFTTDNGLPCDTTNDGHAFYMSNPDTRRGFCMIATSESASVLCNKVNGVTSCLKSTLVGLNTYRGTPYTAQTLTRSDYPTGTYDHLPSGTKTALDNLGTALVYKGNFSSTHFYVVRASKQVLCTPGAEGAEGEPTPVACHVSKTGSCVRCPFPATYWETFNLVGNKHTSHVAHYMYECMGTTTFCQPGTAEYKAYQDIVAVM